MKNTFNYKLIDEKDIKKIKILIQRGVNDGELTIGEIGNSLSFLERISFDLNSFYDHLKSLGISIVLKRSFKEDYEPSASLKNKKRSRRQVEHSLFAFDQYYREVQRIKLLSGFEEYYFSKKVRDNCRESRKKMIEANLRLGINIARGYQNKGLPLLDIFQEANIGLIRAVDKFDYRKGYKFSTYGTWWIRQNIYRSLCDYSRLIRIPVHACERINKMHSIISKLEKSSNEEITDEDIAKKMRIPIKDVEELFSISKETISLESILEKIECLESFPTTLNIETNNKFDKCCFRLNSKNSFEEKFLEDDGSKVYDKAYKSVLKKEIRDILSCLKNKERNILELRFGLIDNHARTLEEIGNELGLTRERIRQIESKALKKLKNNKYIKEYKQNSRNGTQDSFKKTTNAKSKAVLLSKKEFPSKKEKYYKKPLVKFKMYTDDLKMLKKIFNSNIDQINSFISKFEYIKFRILVLKGRDKGEISIQEIGELISSKNITKFEMHKLFDYFQELNIDIIIDKDQQTKYKCYNPYSFQTALIKSKNGVKII